MSRCASGRRETRFQPHRADSGAARTCPARTQRARQTNAAATKHGNNLPATTNNNTGAPAYAYAGVVCVLINAAWGFGRAGRGPEPGWGGVAEPARGRPAPRAGGGHVPPPRRCPRRHGPPAPPPPPRAPLTCGRLPRPRPPASCRSRGRGRRGVVRTVMPSANRGGGTAPVHGR